MCGIYGIVSLTAAEPPDADIAERMAAVSRHRGPDDSGVYRDRHALLGATRLAIIDVAGGHQPVHNEDQDAWAVHNGEIYNFRELRRQLEERGHRFRNHTDSEVIVHAYQEHGPDFLEQIAGMFALAVWDTRTKRLLIARDRLGIKPLYYLHQPHRLVFASEIKAILAVPGVSSEIDPSALRQYLALGYVPAPLSLFAGIRKLPPGSTLTVDGAEVKVRRYWHLPPPEIDSLDEAEWTDAVRARLEEAVVRQMVSDVPLGAFLSGGIDSSAIVAFMARNTSTPVRTYSVGFAGGRAAGFYDELPHARRVARHLGTKHREIILRPDVVGLLPTLLWHLDEPLADSAFLTTYLVAKLAREDVTVALSGLGGDELFGGYTRYLGDYYSRQYRRVPAAVRRHVLLPLSQYLPADRHSPLLNLSRLARQFIRTDELPAEQRYRAHVEVFDDDSIADLCRVDGRAKGNALEDAFERCAEGDWLQRLLRVDGETQLPDDLLLLTDKMTMAASLECRVPFLDEGVVELACRIPSDMKIRGRQTKYILKKALQGLLPEDILQREKRGFGAPLGAWLRDELAPFTSQLLSPESVERRGLLDPQLVTEVVARHQGGREDRTDQLLALVSLEMWSRLYLDGRSTDDVTAEINAEIRP